MRPVIDFDLKSPFAPFYTLGLMCNWTPERHQRAKANLAPTVIETAFGQMIPLVERLHEMAKGEIPPKGRLRAVVTKYLKREPLTELFMAHVGRSVAHVREAVPGIPADMDNEEVYWRSLRVPGKSPYEAMISAIRLNEMLPPDGGIAVMGASPGIDVIDVEIKAMLNGDAYLAGLLLVLVATLHRHHPTLTASVNRACYVLSSDKVVGSRAKTMTHVVKTWAKWKALAPLWAGAIVVAGHWEPEEIWHAIAAVDEPDSLTQLLSVAKWFANFATQFTPPRADNSLILPDEVIEFPDSIEPEEPGLNPLEGVPLEVAKKYKAPTTKYHED